MRFKEKHYLTYEDLQKRDPIYYFSKKFGLPDTYIQEIYRICEVDFRFALGGVKRKYREYRNISDYIYRTWRIRLSPRTIKYIHRVIVNHYKMAEILRRGGKIAGTYRDLILRKS